MALLSAADILTLRRSYLQDLVDDHLEIGASAVTTGTAAAGSYSLALTGLDSGEIPAGTMVAVQAGGRYDLHEITADATITATAATVYLSPALHVSTPGGTPVSPIAERIGLWAEKRGSRFWSDSQIQSFASQASIDYRWQIARSVQPTITLYRGVQLLAFTQLLNSASYLALLYQVDPSSGGAAERTRIQSLIAEARAALQPASHGGYSVPRVR